MSTEICPMGRPAPNYRCRFCPTPLHGGDSGCGCSQYRPTTSYASLCVECASAIDQLTADTPLGRVHRSLVHDTMVRYMHSSD